LLAWGVLGFATGGFLFSLLTLFVFRRNDSENPSSPEKFRNSLIFLAFFVTHSLPASYQPRTRDRVGADAFVRAQPSALGIFPV
jgi:hypothetical protein